MGKISRHGLSSSLFMYMGLALGFISTSFLFPRVLGKEIYGFCQFLIHFCTTISVISLAGLTGVNIRFFPKVKDYRFKHHGYLSFITWRSFLGLTISLVLLFGLHSQIIHWFDDQDYLESYYYLIVPLIVFYQLFINYSSYAGALMRPRMSVFFEQVVTKSVVILLISAVYFKWIDVDLFLKLFGFHFAPMAIALIVFLIVIKEFRLTRKWSFKEKINKKEMNSYGRFMIIAQIGNKLITRIDVFMITYFLDYAAVGVYSLFFFIASVIRIPHRGMNPIAAPVISDLWHKNDRNEIQKLFQKFSLTNLIPAVLIFSLILINIRPFVQLVGEEYAIGINLVYYLGFAELLNVLFGYNSLIIVHSRKYKYDLVFRFITASVNIILNYIAINTLQWGIEGAAIATAITTILFNLLMQSFIYSAFKFYPFQLRSILIFIVAMPLILPFFWIDFSGLAPFWQIAIQSVLFTIPFALLIYLLKLSPDLNKMINKMFSKIFNR